jgi:hypothetical protein
MHTFKINALIKFFKLLKSPTRFEPRGFILRKRAVNAVFVRYGYMNRCKQSIGMRNVLNSKV